MSSFKELEKLPNLKVGEVVVLKDTSADDVRKHLKEHPDLKSTGHRVVEVGSGVVTVVRTAGRVSKMKQALIDRINQMHPFERVHIRDYRLAYVRNVLKEIKDNTGQELHCGPSFQMVDEDGPQIVEIWKDPFSTWTKGEKDMPEMISSFIKQTAVLFDCGESDVLNQIEFVLQQEVETAETADSQE